MPEVILPCPNPACGSENISVVCGEDEITMELYHIARCTCCGMRGPAVCAHEPAAIAAWNALPRMSTIIAWQLQAAGAALALQRLLDAAHAMRETQRAYEKYGSNEDSVTEAEAVFDGLLDDIRRKTGGHHA